MLKNPVKIVNKKTGLQRQKNNLTVEKKSAAPAPQGELGNRELVVCCRLNDKWGRAGSDVLFA